jgi:hypothetical protein
MQDILYEVPRPAEIRDTLVALVKAMPNSMQEYDLQRIVMPQLNSEQPMLIGLQPVAAEEFVREIAAQCEFRIFGDN